jgi:hypothetical protein
MRRMRWAEDVAVKGEIRNAQNILVERHEGMRSLRRFISRWDDIVT